LGEACAPRAALSDKERGKIENFEIYYFLFEIQIIFLFFGRTFSINYLSVYLGGAGVFFANFMIIIMKIIKKLET
jgi:hypothetical protein